MLEGVGVVSVAKVFVSLPIILHPTGMHTEVNVAQNGVHRLQQRHWATRQRLCACEVDEQTRTHVDEGFRNHRTLTA